MLYLPKQVTLTILLIILLVSWCMSLAIWISYHDDHNHRYYSNLSSLLNNRTEAEKNWNATCRTNTNKDLNEYCSNLEGKFKGITKEQLEVAASASIKHRLLLSTLPIKSIFSFFFVMVIIVFPVLLAVISIQFIEHKIKKKREQELPISKEVQNTAAAVGNKKNQ